MGGKRKLAFVETLDHDYVGIDPANNAVGSDVYGNLIYEGNVVYGVTIRSENSGTATGNVLSNDTAPAGLKMSIAAGTQTTAHGSVVENADGTFTLPLGSTVHSNSPNKPDTFLFLWIQNVKLYYIFHKIPLSPTFCHK